MELPVINFFDSETMGKFWQFVSVILLFIMPLFMIGMAVTFGQEFITMIIRVFRPKKEGDERYDIKIKDKY